MNLSQNVRAEELRKERVLCVGFLIDNSGSMNSYQEVVPRAWETYIDLIRNSSEKNDILVNPIIFGSGNPESRGYRFIEDQVSIRYSANDDHTNLYNSIAISLQELNETVATYKAEGFNRTRGLLIILSDGIDNVGGGEARRHAINAIDATEKSGGMVAYIAFGEDAYGEAERLGVKHVKETNATVEDLQDLFITASQSTIQYSKSNGIQTGKNFFDNTMHGNGNGRRVNR